MIIILNNDEETVLEFCSTMQLFGKYTENELPV